MPERRDDEEDTYDDSDAGVGSNADGTTTHLQPWQNDFASIPLLGSFSGAAGAVARNEDIVEGNRNRAIWRELQAGAPSAAELTPETYLESDTDEYGNLMGGQSAWVGEGTSGGANAQRSQMQALRNLYDQGGYTDADRTMSQALRAQQAQQMGAANAATQQQMQARGMGGSGTELALRQQSNEAMAGANAQSDASIQQAAMQRALQALQGAGQMSNAYRGAEQSRMHALDSYNQSNNDWRRGRENRNTQWANQGAANDAQARQQSYENREHAAAGMTNQYSTDVNARNTRRAADTERDNNAIAAIGEIFG
jgi:hypothetical protein